MQYIIGYKTRWADNRRGQWDSGHLVTITASTTREVEATYRRIMKACFGDALDWEITRIEAAPGEYPNQAQRADLAYCYYNGDLQQALYRAIHRNGVPGYIVDLCPRSGSLSVVALSLDSRYAVYAGPWWEGDDKQYFQIMDDEGNFANPDEMNIPHTIAWTGDVEVDAKLWLEWITPLLAAKRDMLLERSKYANRPVNPA